MKKILLFGILISISINATEAKPIPKKRNIPKKTILSTKNLQSERENELKQNIINQYKAQGITHMDMLYKGWVEKDGYKVPINFNLNY